MSNIENTPNAPVAIISEASPEQRAQALALAVAAQVRDGWNVESQTANQAVMVQPGTKVNHILHLLLSCFTLGLWLIVWLFVALLHKREKHLVITVDAFGQTLLQRS